MILLAHLSFAVLPSKSAEQRLVAIRRLKRQSVNPLLDGGGYYSSLQSVQKWGFDFNHALKIAVEHYGKFLEGPATLR